MFQPHYVAGVDWPSWKIPQTWIPCAPTYHVWPRILAVDNDKSPHQGYIHLLFGTETKDDLPGQVTNAIKASGE